MLATLKNDKAKGRPSTVHDDLLIGAWDKLKSLQYLPIKKGFVNKHIHGVKQEAGMFT